MSLTAPRIKTHLRLQTDLPFFSRHCLRIEDKQGRLVEFVNNQSQDYIHTCLEKQRRELGKVRAIIVKARQEGCSTYVGARFYHRALFRDGTRVYILSHLTDTTDKLFRMVNTFHDHVPDYFKSKTVSDNHRYLEFSNRSQYSVGTAGSRSVGRGGTVQLFHGSEVAFWRDADQVRSGVIQSIPDSDDTEVILESTANGQNGYFWDMTQAALAGRNQYQVIFIPWFWMDEYRIEIPEDFTITEEEQEIADLYDLDDEQICWRREKIVDLGSLRLFYQEYPASLDEAFQSSGDSLIDPMALAKARKRAVVDKNAAVIIGVDCAPEKDNVAIAFRRGREIPIVRKYPPMDEMALAGKLAHLINEYGPDAVFVDKAYGRGTVARLHERGFQRVVKGVDFGSAPDDDRFINKRAEMWWRVKEWIEREEPSIPDENYIASDLLSMPSERLNSSQRIGMAPKKDIIKEIGHSPDVGDSIALTFAYDVVSKKQQDYAIETRYGRAKKKPSQLKSLRRIRREDIKSDELRIPWVGL